MSTLTQDAVATFVHDKGMLPFAAMLLQSLRDPGQWNGKILALVPQNFENSWQRQLVCWIGNGGMWEGLSGVFDRARWDSL